MGLHKNLLRDGFEEVAERISEVVRARRARQMVAVSDSGKVRVDAASKLLALEFPVHTIVGTYDRNARIELIEGDLLERLRELQFPEQAAA
jgi:hypothetical protein